MRNYYAKNKQKYHKWYVRSKYGIEINDYENLLAAQDNKCAICRKPASEITKRLFVDHDHKTNAVRGLLCSDCNFGLGNFKDSKKLLLSAAKYL